MINAFSKVIWTKFLIMCGECVCVCVPVLLSLYLIVHVRVCFLFLSRSLSHSICLTKPCSNFCCSYFQCFNSMCIHRWYLLRCSLFLCYSKLFSSSYFFLILFLFPFFLCFVSSTKIISVHIFEFRVGCVLTFAHAFSINQSTRQPVKHRAQTKTFLLYFST